MIHLGMRDVTRSLLAVFLLLGWTFAAQPAHGEPPPGGPAPEGAGPAFSPSSPKNPEIFRLASVCLTLS